MLGTRGRMNWRKQPLVASSGQGRTGEGIDERLDNPAGQTQGFESSSPSLSCCRGSAMTDGSKLHHVRRSIAAPPFTVISHRVLGNTSTRQPKGEREKAISHLFQLTTPIICLNSLGRTLPSPTVHGCMLS